MATSTKVIKGSALFEESGTGSHYYAFSPAISTARYTEAMANIVLPTRLELNGTGSQTKYAYISLGIGGPNGNGDAVDLGIANHGNGWYPVYNDVEGKTGQHFTAYTAPASATNAMIVVKPISTTKLGLYVEFCNAAGQMVGAVFDKTLYVTAHTWSRYYRFASLLDFGSNPMNDSTYMIGGKFTSLLVYDGTQQKYVPWGIFAANPALISNAWIIGFNKCQLPQYNSTTETFQIDNWAD